MSRHDQSSAPKGSHRRSQAGLPDELLTAPRHQDDLDEQLAEGRRGPGKLTLALGAAILVVCGIAGGIAIEKAMAPEQTARSQAGTRAAGTGETAGQRGSGEGGRAGSGGGGAVIGTVERIEGGTVYVKTGDGQTVKVKTTGDTRVQVTKEGSAEDLASGQTVAVSGERAEDGSLSATVISQGTSPRGSGRGGPAKNETQEDPS
ncbi:DUF5666 domain-containing protein [Streptomyces sp. NPDC048331]|uniref:DUF5666 domain-containing protein n=1 Tax=Streptomyces sp. NPDC048331 TaxID=3365534 RepID=UPI003716AB08